MSSNVSIRLKNDHVLTCFRIGYNESTGTCFIYSNDNGVFFVTAAHVLQGCRVGDRVCFQKDDALWRFYHILDIAFADERIDVCTFSLSDLILDAKNEYHIHELSISLGEEVKFLGYPHGLNNTYPANGYAAPLVRTAYFSGAAVINDIELAIFDGFNNPGYSGGPVYARREDGEVGVFAIISGYRTETPTHSKVYRKLPGHSEEEVLGHYTKPNSGMIYAHLVVDIERCAKKLRNLNPLKRPDV